MTDLPPLSNTGSPDKVTSTRPWVQSVKDLNTGVEGVLYVWSEHESGGFLSPFVRTFLKLQKHKLKLNIKVVTKFHK